MTIPQTQTIEEIAAQARAGKVLIVKNHNGVHLLWAKDDVLFAQTAKSVFQGQLHASKNTVFGDLSYVRQRVRRADIMRVLPTYTMACLYLRKCIKSTGFAHIDEWLKEQGLL